MLTTLLILETSKIQNLLALGRTRAPSTPMSTTDVSERSATVPSLIVNSSRQSAAYNPRPRLSREQVTDLSTVLDALIVGAAFIASQFLYPLVYDGELSGSANYLLVAVITSLVHYAVARTQSGGSRQFAPCSMSSIVCLLLTTFAIVITLGYALKQAEVHSRLWLALSFLIAFAAIVAKNRLLRRAGQTGVLQQFVVERIALFGDPAITSSLKASLESQNESLYRISVYDEEDPSLLAGIDLDRLIEDGLDNKFDRIVLCLPPGNVETLKDVVDMISFLPARIEICVAHAEIQALQSHLLLSPGQILVNIIDSPQDAWGRMVKRGMDIVLGSIFLVLAAPVMIAAAIAIKLESKGPIFFRQDRHGWNHSIISIWKFRSMHVQENGAVIKQAVHNDPRVTKVGRFLRKTSIDELPQLFNVLMGEMSLVGPRPHAVAHNVQYSEAIDSYAYRHKVKPGITGWAQVNGLRGNSEDISKMIARAEADIWYIRNWSLLLDIKIMLLTPVMMLLHKEAL